ncbi:MAG: pyridoxal phosphate-dependent aminotransferase [Methanobacteriota archaeon]
MTLSARVQDVPPSATFKWSALSKKQGVLNLTVGRPNYDTPKIIKEACKKALDEGKVHYAPSKGIPELREKIAGKLSTENKVAGIDADKILVSGGAKNVLYLLFQTLVDDGVVVALPDPAWVSYEPMVNLAGGKVDWLALKPEEGFVADEDYLNALENSKAKVTLINSPCNPTGAFWSKGVQEKIVDICERKGMWIISDEVYEYFAYDGEPWSPGEVYEKTITVNAFSKSFSMTGWRLGYGACPDQSIIDAMNRLQQHSLSNATTFAQWGALACFTKEARKESEAMVADFKERREVCMKAIEGIEGVVCKKPGGAFYLFPSFGDVDDTELAEKLIEKGVGTIPGSAFGTVGEGCIRISYGSASPDELKTAFDTIKEVVEK